MLSNFVRAIGVFFVVVAAASPALAQKTKAQLQTEVNTTFPDNTTGQITPAGVRAFENDLINSILPTAPVTAGNLACFNGTTGLLQDCGLSPTTLVIPNSQLAQMPALTFKGNNAAVPAGAADLTQAQATALLNPFTSSLQGVVPPSGGGTTNYLRADGTWAPLNCPSGTFCVSSYPSVAAAFTAATAAGGGTVFFSQSTTLSAAQTVGSNIKIECADTGVTISTSSTTADLFTITGTNVTVTHCGLAYAGTPGTKTAGSLVNMGGISNVIDDVHFGPYCYFCVAVGGSISTINNVFFDGNISAAPAAGSGAIYINITNSVTHISNMTLAASTTGDFYDFGIRVFGGAIDVANAEIITAKQAVWLSPTSGASVFFKMTTSYLDNCLTTCALVQPNAGGAIGYAEFSNTEFGVLSGGSCLNIDTASGGTGNVGSVKVTNSELFNYQTGGNCVNLLGSLGSVMLSNNIIGQGSAVGLAVNASTSCGCSVIGNSFFGSTNSIYLASVLSNALIMWNRLNGHGITTGGNSATNVANNLP
jgi:hypothetical protein